MKQNYVSLVIAVCFFSFTVVHAVHEKKEQQWREKVTECLKELNRCDSTFVEYQKINNHTISNILNVLYQ
jgi:hypothetical protein